MSFAKVIKSVNDKVMKKHGRNMPFIFTPGSDLSAWEGEKIPCNVSAINKDLGGGFKTGNIHLITGNPGAGKTALISSVMKNALDKGYHVMYVAMEPGLPSSTWANVGLDQSRVHIVAPTCAEDISEMTLAVLKDLRDQTDERVIIAFDSINAFIPSNMVRRMDEKGHDSAGMAERARALAVFLERLGGESMLMSQSMVFIVAQKRMSLGDFIVTSKISGGMAVQYTPKTLLHLNSKTIKTKKPVNGIDVPTPTAIEVKYELEKNTAGGERLPNGKIVGNVPTAGAYVYSFPTEDFAGGVDDSALLFEYAAAAGIQQKQGRLFVWVFEDGTEYVSDATKKDEAIEWFRLNTELCDRIRSMIEAPVIEEEPEEETIQTG